MHRDDPIREIRATARRGINQARRLRKYMPRGPYSPVEREALAALVKIARAAGELLTASTENE